MINILRKSFTAAMLLAAGTMGARAQGTITTVATITNPDGLAVDAAGNVYVAQQYSATVKKIDGITGALSTYAGGGSSMSYGIAPTSAMLERPKGIFINAASDILITDYYFDMTFSIDHTTGMIASRCGCHSQGCDGDGGGATLAKMELPTASCEDVAGNTYICSQGCGNVRKVDRSTGLASTILTGGSYSSGYSAVFFDPTSTTDLYVASGSRILKYNTATGVQTFVVGTGVMGNTGDGGQAINATLGSISGMFIDASHNLYFTDPTYHVVRMVSLTTGQIHTLAGNGSAGYTGDGGVSPHAQLYSPQGVWVDNNGYVYISDAGNNAIRKIAPKGHKPNGGVMQANEISIYPNPSTGAFTLTTDEDLDNSVVTVFNVVGAQVYSTTLSGNTNLIDMGKQAPGMYTLVMKTANGTHTEKLSVQ